MQKALEIREKELGEGHPNTALSYNNLATNLDGQDRYDEAEPLYRKALEICEKVLGEGHPTTINSFTRSPIPTPRQSSSLKPLICNGRSE